MFVGPPAENIESHFGTLKNLLAEPVFQGRRLIERMQEKGSVEIFDMNSKPLLTLTSKNFNVSAVLAVSLEQLTDLSPMVHKFKKLGLASSGPPAWVLSIDDLRAYRNILANPTEFSHLLVERLKAFQNPSLNLDDELDHLGLNFAHNCYHDITDDHKADRIIWHGYRSEIDKYFYRLLADPSNAARPSQAIPVALASILDVLWRKGRPGFARAGRALLDFDGKAREMLAENIKEVAELQSQQMRTRRFSFAGEVSLSVVLEIANLPISAPFNPQEYALSNMVAQKRDAGLLLIVKMDKDRNILDVEFDWVSSAQLAGPNEQRIHQMAKELGAARIRRFKESSGKAKVGRNDTCPCGSGIKFKNCHGK